MGVGLVPQDIDTVLLLAPHVKVNDLRNDFRRENFSICDSKAVLT
jgi:hypothetical protein